MSNGAICPCGEFIHPAVILNRPGLLSLRYRAGDFVSFRSALLRPLAGEQQLTLWSPGASGDLAVQMVEWFAYLADILTFYNERIVNEAFLRTATQPAAVQGLVRILSYRPRPGIGAAGVVAALVSEKKPIVVPAGYQIQSKPGPGQEPQTFEVDVATTAAPGGVVSADVAPGDAITNSVLLEGEITTIQPSEQLLLIERGWTGTAGDALYVTVSTVVVETSPRGTRNTRVTFAPAAGAGALTASSARLMRFGQSIGIWPYDATTVADVDEANLASVARSILPGDPVVFQVGGGTPSDTVARVTSYVEQLWFANPPDPDTPEDGPDPNVEIPIPILHALIGVSPDIPATVNTDRSVTQVKFAWVDVGRLIPIPAANATGAQLTVNPVNPPAFPVTVPGQSLLIEGANGDGVSATVLSGSSTTQLVLSPVGAAPVLAAPLNIYFNTVPVSRGKSVKSEVLGSGDPTIAGQEFLLKKSPVTYLASTDPESPDPYESTLRVYVNGIEWDEAPSFFGQPESARVFVTREDEENKTHVQFGDGVNGARLPAGASNVLGFYRYESGAQSPDPGKLNVLTQPLPGLKSIVSPVNPAGGSDPDSASQLRTLAPRSALTFNRAVSGDDYTVIASQTPGVVRARAYWAFDPITQRTGVTVYVGDTAGAVTAALNALRRVVDPNRPLTVLQALPMPVDLTITIVIGQGFLAENVVPSVRAAITDPDTGLLGENVVRIGQTLFRSQLYEVCLRVPGVIAVHGLSQSPYKYFPGEGFFFQLAPDDLIVNVEPA